MRNLTLRPFSNALNWRLKACNSYDRTILNAIKHKILVVDGSRATRKMVELKLSDEQFSVQAAAGANQALAKAHRELFSLVTTAISLPDEDCRKFIADLRRVPGYQNTPVLVVSGDEVPENYFEAELGVTAVLTKGEGIDALVEAIHRYTPEKAPSAEDATTAIFTILQ